MYLSSHLKNRTAAMEHAIQTAHDELLNETNYKAYIQTLIDKYSTQPLLLHVDRREVSKYQKTLTARELSPDIRLGIGLNPYGSQTINQTMLRCHLPISGDTALLELDPTQSNRLSLPKLIISNNEICFDVAFNPNQPEESLKSIQNYIAWIQQQVSYINTDLADYNTRLKNQIDRVIQKKRQDINHISDALTSFDIPLRKETEKTFPPIISPVIIPTVSNEYYSVAISYGDLDINIATLLNEFLIAKDIKTWFFPVNAKLGQKLVKTMFEMANEYDRVILICSKSSLERHGVLNEIEEVFAREAREGGREILIPVRLDDYVFNWSPERSHIAVKIKDKVIGKLTATDFKSGKSNQNLLKILDALKK